MIFQMVTALAATAMAAMSMAVPLHADSAAAEAAISDAAIVRPSSVRPRPALRAAVARPDKAHRHGAHGRGSHHRQDDAARTFHGSILCQGQRSDAAIETLSSKARKPKAILSRHRAAKQTSAAAEKMRREGVGKRPNPAARHVAGTRWRGAGRRFIP